MKNVFIFHGYGGNSKENWIPWLKQELENEKNINVVTPDFPTPQNQTFKNWCKVLNKYKKYFTSDTIFVGHSLGCPFILSYLTREKLKIDSAFLVAPFDRALGVTEIDQANASFLQNLNVGNCTKYCVGGGYYAFYSDNDPYIPIKISENIIKKLNAKPMLIVNGGHMNESAGFTKFELLRDEIFKIL